MTKLTCTRQQYTYSNETHRACLMRFPVAAIRPRRVSGGRHLATQSYGKVRKGVVVYKEVLGKYAINSSKSPPQGKPWGAARMQRVEPLMEFRDAVRAPQPDLTWTPQGCLVICTCSDTLCLSVLMCMMKTNHCNKKTGFTSLFKHSHTWPAAPAPYPLTAQSSSCKSQLIAWNFKRDS